MLPLEQKIINLLPTLSERAKKEARFILGSNPIIKRRSSIPIETARLDINKFLKQTNHAKKRK